MTSIEVKVLFLLFFLLFLFGCITNNYPNSSSVIPFISTSTISSSIPNSLLSCDLNSHTPPALPPVRTTAKVVEGYNELELSREAILAQLLNCDGKRKELVKRLNEFLSREAPEKSLEKEVGK